MTTNVFEVSSLVAKTMTEFFVQKSPILNTANRNYVEEFSQQNYATGGTINVKVPAYPSVQNGLAVTPEGIEDLVIPYTITVNDIYSIPRELNLFEQRFNILGTPKSLTAPIKKAIVDNYAYPAFQALEGAIENTAASRLKTTAYFSPIDSVDLLGNVNSYSSISALDSMCELMKLSSDRYLMMNILDAQKVSDSLQNMFNTSINTNITKNARLGGPDKGRLAGFDVYRSTQLLKHTAGALKLTAGITVSSLSADGTVLTLTGVPSTTSTLVKAGDRISIVAVHLVSPITFDVLPYRLVVTAAADANGNGSGQVAVTLSYPLLASGEHANVDSLPANGDAVMIFPDYNLNFAYVPSGLSAVPLPLGDIYGAANSDVRGENKVPVKVQMQGSVQQYTNIFRISMLVGIRAFAPYIVALPSLAS